MAGRITRGAAAKEAAFKASPEKGTRPQQLSSPPATPVPTKKKATPAKKPSKVEKTPKPKAQDKVRQVVMPTSTGRKRKRAGLVKIEDDINELPHNLGKVVAASDGNVKGEVKEAEPSLKKRSPGKPAARKEEMNDIEETVTKATAAADTTKESLTRKARKPKANAYGLTPGETPYPDWPHPTPEECQEVNDLLAKVHGVVQAPKTIPAPSITVSGCGEVPSILDALIRTLLSAATTGANSSRAFKGLVDRFGLLQEGIGKGSVDWDAVRRAELKDVFEAIKSGGLAATKSKRIKEILEMVYEENKSRRNALVEAKEVDSATGPKGAENETATQKEAEIARADERVLSLDHLHALSSDEALNTLIKYPGIGPKTASCVLLFCMQRPSFAVDTHVFRLCKWLHWVPPTKATRNSTYSHCEVRIPDELKYPLHQLFIRHGKTCPRCRAATGEGSGEWDQGCPIEHLVTRTGKRKGGKEGLVKGIKKGKKGAESDEESDEVVEEDDDDESEVDKAWT
ncbi:hypothetical protein MMC08_001774 [Hypocenomyce scalaris]|nr:hypothetical protein [Hypocenomyce scalaris]